MAWTLSAAASAALAKSHTVAVQVEVWSGNTLEKVLAGPGVSGEVVAGSVTDDETRLVRRQCSLTIATEDLVPSEASDLLHPLSGNELRIYRGVTLPGVTPSTAPGGTMAPLGVFRMSKPVISDTGDKLTVAVTGMDRSSEIQARQWTGPYLIGGPTVDVAIQEILNDRWGSTLPALTYNLTPTSVRLPGNTTLGIQFTSQGTQAASGSTSGGNNPLQDIMNIAASAGCEFLFDRQGIPTLRAIPQVGSVPVAFEYVEGETCTMGQLQRTLDSTSFCNGVVVIGTGAVVTNADGSTSPGAPVYGEAWSADPNYGPSGPLGKRPKIITSQTVATSAQAVAMAQANLPLYTSSLDSTAFTASEDPRVDSGDGNGIVRLRMRVANSYIVSAVTHPLDVATAMSVTNRAASVATVAA